MIKLTDLLKEIIDIYSYGRRKYNIQNRNYPTY
jgi:hypothetical protein